MNNIPYKSCSRQWFVNQSICKLLINTLHFEMSGDNTVTHYQRMRKSKTVNCWKLGRYSFSCFILTSSINDSVLMNSNVKKFNSTNFSERNKSNIESVWLQITADALHHIYRIKQQQETSNSSCNDMPLSTEINDQKDADV